MHDVYFTWWDSLRYYYYYFEHAYAEYAFVVQVSYFMSVFSVVSIFVMFLIMLSIWERRSRHKRYRRKYAKYHEPRFEQVLNAPTKLTQAECHDLVQRRPTERLKKWQYREQLGLITDIYERLRQEKTTEEVRRVFYCNVRVLIAYLGIDVYMEDLLREGVRADRLYIMQVTQQFHLKVAESTLSRLYDCKIAALRKTVRIYYMWMSREDPFRFLEEGYDNDFVLIDTLMIHHVFAMRRGAGKPLPPLLPYAESCTDENLRATMICEVGWWSSDEEVHEVKRYFNSSNELCRASAFSTVGQRRYVPLEGELIKAFSQQTEDLRRVVLRSVAAIGSGKAIDFFEKVACQTSSDTTRRCALYCLWHYGPAGKAAFEQLRAADTPERQQVYEYIQMMSPTHAATYHGMRMQASLQQ